MHVASPLFASSVTRVISRSAVVKGTVSGGTLASIVDLLPLDGIPAAPVYSDTPVFGTPDLTRSGFDVPSSTGGALKSRIELSGGLFGLAPLLPSAYSTCIVTLTKSVPTVSALPLVTLTGAL